jgi:hypothetical protein
VLWLSTTPRERIALRILNLGARWSWVISFTPWTLYPQGKSPSYTLNRRLGGSQSRSGRGGEENPRSSSPQPSAIPLSYPGSLIKFQLHVQLKNGHIFRFCFFTQPSLGLGFHLKIRLNFLEASQQFSFLQGRIVSPMPNPHPGGLGLCIYIPQRQGGYPF